MWKKTDSLDDLVSSNIEPKPAPSRSEPRMKSSELANIGPSISIRGDLTGDEDLIIRGRVEGTISLKQHNLTIGSEGRIKADVHASNITVEGQLEGDLHAKEQIVVRRSGQVHGNIVSPRVSLEDGCKFKGSVDMDSSSAGVSDTDSVKVSSLRPSGSSVGEKPTTQPGKSSSSAHHGKAN